MDPTQSKAIYEYDFDMSKGVSSTYILFHSTIKDDTDTVCNTEEEIKTKGKKLYIGMGTTMRNHELLDVTGTVALNEFKVPKLAPNIPTSIPSRVYQAFAHKGMYDGELYSIPNIREKYDVPPGFDDIHVLYEDKKYTVLVPPPPRTKSSSESSDASGPSPEPTRIPYNAKSIIGESTQYVKYLGPVYSLGYESKPEDVSGIFFSHPAFVEVMTKERFCLPDMQTRPGPKTSYFLYSILCPFEERKNLNDLFNDRLRQLLEYVPGNIEELNLEPSSFEHETITIDGEILENFPESVHSYILSSSDYSCKLPASWNDIKKLSINMQKLFIEGDSALVVDELDFGETEIVFANEAKVLTWTVSKSLLMRKLNINTNNSANKTMNIISHLASGTTISIVECNINLTEFSYVSYSGDALMFTECDLRIGNMTLSSLKSVNYSDLVDNSEFMISIRDVDECFLNSCVIGSSISRGNSPVFINLLGGRFDLMLNDVKIYNRKIIRIDNMLIPSPNIEIFDSLLVSDICDKHFEMEKLTIRNTRLIIPDYVDKTLIWRAHEIKILGNSNIYQYDEAYPVDMHIYTTLELEISESSMEMRNIEIFGDVQCNTRKINDINVKIKDSNIICHKTLGVHDTTMTNIIKSSIDAFEDFYIVKSKKTNIRNSEINRMIDARKTWQKISFNDIEELNITECNMNIDEGESQDIALKGILTANMELFCKLKNTVKIFIDNNCENIIFNINDDRSRNLTKNIDKTNKSECVLHLCDRKQNPETYVYLNLFGTWNYQILDIQSKVCESAILAPYEVSMEKDPYKNINTEGVV